MTKGRELFIGIILLVVGIWGIYYFSTFGGHGAIKIVEDVNGAQTAQVSPVLIFIEGIWGILVTLIGLVFFALGISELKG